LEEIIKSTAFPAEKITMETHGAFKDGQMKKVQRTAENLVQY
jgi:hypothetical protein